MKSVKVLLTLGILACLVGVSCANQPTAAGSPSSSPLAAAQNSQVCSSPGTQPSNQFAAVRGWITYNDDTGIRAVDPRQPGTHVVLRPSTDLSPIAWSRDGSRLLVKQESRAGDSIRDDLCVMKPDGSLTRVTGDGRSSEGSFSPDGSRIVYARVDAGLYVVDANGGTPRLLARSYADWWLGSPAWSPDGSRIAYSVYTEGGPDAQVWTVNPDGTGARPLFHMARCRVVWALGWSPDGSMLAFQVGCDVGPSIYVVRADGSGLRPIYSGGFRPAWSPDGSRIAFAQGADLFTMAPDGQDVRQLGVFVLSYTSVTWNPVVRT